MEIATYISSCIFHMQLPSWRIYCLITSYTPSNSHYCMLSHSRSFNVLAIQYFSKPPKNAWGFIYMFYVLSHSNVCMKVLVVSNFIMLCIISSTLMACIVQLWYWVSCFVSESICPISYSYHLINSKQHTYVVCIYAAQVSYNSEHLTCLI